MPQHTDRKRAQAKAPSRKAAYTRLVLHGHPCLQVGDGQMLALERRAAALCALAALEPGLTRDLAARWLWPDSEDPRRNLRQQLLRFRQTLGCSLLSGDITLTLAPGVELAAAQPGTELLQGTVTDGSDFGVWLAHRRIAEARSRLQPLEQALADAEARGDLDTALAQAQQLVLLDPADEDHHAALMRVHFLRGESSAGVRVFKKLKELLAAQHGGQPAKATEELAAALLELGRARPLTRTAWAGSTLPVTLKRPPRLAGRARESAALGQAWAEGRAVLLKGEAGMGKSRLMADCLAGLPGVLHSAARPGDAGAPYSTLARLLQPLLQPVPAALDALSQATLSQVVTMAPSAGSSEAGSLRPGALLAAVSALLDQAQVHSQAQTVALDDLHFADMATLELISGLASQERPRRWLFAQRAAEGSSAAQALQDGLSELQRLTVIELSPLNTAAAADLVDALGIPGLQGQTLAPALVQHSGGNPLFLLETLKQGLSDGSLARGELPRPGNVSTLIELRLQRLSEPALTLSRVAAIAGVDFCIELAESAIGQSAVQLASAWHELQEAQVLRDEGFAHDLVAEAALRGVPPVVARRVHGQCALWLAARHAEPARVARHWLLGGVPAEAGHAFVAAALRAEKAARLHEEAALYAQAAQAYGQAGLSDEHFNALLGRVRSLNKAAYDDQATQACRALIATAQSDTQRLCALSELCGLLTERGESLAALEAGDSALVLARQLGNTEWQVRTACHMATALGRLGRPEEALALLAPLRAAVDAQANEPLRMLWHGEWAAALGNNGRLTEAVSAFDEALGAARRCELSDAQGRLLLNCSITLRQSGQLERALVMSRQGQALSAAAMRDASELPIDALVMARAEAETGHYGTALQTLERVLPEFDKRGAAFWIQACRMVLARLWLDLGQHARVGPLLRDEAADLPAWLRADRCLLQLELARALEQPAPAGWLEQTLDHAATDRARGPALVVRALRSMTFDQVSERAQALAPALGQKERFGALLALQVHVARAATQEGRHAEAATAARAAAALLQAGYAPEALYLPEAYSVLWQSFTAVGADADAAQAVRVATQWIRSRALPEVPAPFLDSFLNRNRTNRALLALA